MQAGRVVAARRVLMICYAFPPAGGPGVQRSAKFAKYLPRFGWRPIVWSLDRPGDLPRDATLLADMPADVDHRVRRAWDTSRWPMRAAGVARHALGNWLHCNGLAEGAAWRAERWTRSLLRMLPPDGLTPWALASIAPLRRLMARERVDVIYSTYSPAANHLLAMLLASATHRPWVADFRDLWTDDYRYPRNGAAGGRRFRRCVDRSIEQRFLETADAIVCATPGMTEVLAARVAHRAERFTTITNGVDLEDMPAPTGVANAPVAGCQRTPERGFVLAHVGRFTRERIAEPLIAGMAEFARAAAEAGERFELRIVGHLPRDVASQLTAAGVRWSSPGYVSHGASIREMMAADVLLLAVAPQTEARAIMTGKVFEYLASGRPILLVGNVESDAARLVRSCDAGVTVPMHVSGIHAALAEFWQQWRTGRLRAGCASERLALFTRQRLTGQLAHVFESVCRRRRGVRTARGAT